MSFQVRLKIEFRCMHRLEDGSLCNHLIGYTVTGEFYFLLADGMNYGKIPFETLQIQLRCPKCRKTVWWKNDQKKKLEIKV